MKLLIEGTLKQKPRSDDSCYHAIFIPDDRFPKPKNWKEVLLWVPTLLFAFTVVLLLTMFDKVIDSWMEDK